MTFLADVNFIIAILHARHAHSARAVSWLEGQQRARSILLCRVVQMGVLRILTNARWLGKEALSTADVWQAWDLLLSDDRFARTQEPGGLEVEWRRLTRNLPPGQSAETDTYLAAFAVAGGHHVLTFDRDFERFEGVDALVLR
jgi:uncharacterized protein